MYSVIIPTLWIPETFSELLDKLVSCEYISEVIIIDNNYKKRPNFTFNNKIKLIQQENNIFVNKAWNIGVDLSSSNNICLMNDDILFDVDRLFEYLRDINLDDLGLIGTNIMSTSSNLELIDVTDHKWCFGFGCLMFISKVKYCKIPDQLSIHYGDSYLLLKNLEYGILQIEGLETNKVVSITSCSSEYDDIKTTDYFVWNNIQKDI